MTEHPLRWILAVHLTRAKNKASSREAIHCAERYDRRIRIESTCDYSEIMSYDHGEGDLVSPMVSLSLSIGAYPVDFAVCGRLEHRLEGRSRFPFASFWGNRR